MEESPSDADAALRVGDVTIAYLANINDAFAFGERLEQIGEKASGDTVVEVHGNRVYWAATEQPSLPKAAEERYDRIVAIGEGE